MDALNSDPRLVLDIMDLRHYARAKVEVETAGKKEDVSGWAKRWVFEVQAARLERRNRQRAKKDGNTV